MDGTVIKQVARMPRLIPRCFFSFVVIFFLLDVKYLFFRLTSKNRGQGVCVHDMRTAAAAGVK